MDLFSAVRYIRSEGQYKVQISDVTQGISPNKTKYISITFEDGEHRKITDKFYLSEDARWKLIELVDAIGWTDEEKKMGLKKDNFVGRKCKIEVEKRKDKATLASYYIVVGFDSCEDKSID